MAIPAGVETVTVSSGEPLTLPDGTFVRGHIRFVAPPLMVVPSDDYTLGGEAVAELVNGEFSIVLVAGDATDINPTGWTYAVYGEFVNAVDWTSEAFLVKANPSVFLADVLQPDASLPNYFTQKLPLAGGTMTGDIVLAGDPTAALHPATKQYTDAADALRVLKAGDTMTGPLILSGGPSTDLQASTKKYTDDQDALKLTLAGGDTITGPTALTDNADISIPDITELLGALVPTGMIRGGSVDMNTMNPIAVDIAPFVGYIADATADEDSPFVVRVHKDTTTTIVNSNPANPITWYFLNKDGTFGQQTTEPTGEDRVAKLQLGFSLQSGGLIIEAQTTHERITQRTGDWARFMESLGSFAVRGEEMFVSPNGANLKINTSAGKIFNRAINLFNGPTLEYDRNVNVQDALVAPKFRIGTRDPLSLSGAVTDTIIPGMYDVGGVATAVPNPTGNVTIQRVYYSPLANPEDRLFVQYGQSVYASIDQAVQAIGTTNYQVNPLLKFTLLIGYIVVTKTATALNNTGQAVILPSERFRIR